jgi:hypothetical protein
MGAERASSRARELGEQLAGALTEFAQQSACSPDEIRDLLDRALELAALDEVPVVPEELLFFVTGALFDLASEQLGTERAEHMLLMISPLLDRAWELDRKQLAQLLDDGLLDDGLDDGLLDDGPDGDARPRRKVSGDAQRITRRPQSHIQRSSERAAGRSDAPEEPTPTSLLGSGEDTESQYAMSPGIRRGCGPESLAESVKYSVVKDLCG